jgi:type I restriction enzyme, S subunit
MSWLTPTIDSVCEPTGQRDPQERPKELFRYVDISSIDRERKVIVSTMGLVGAEAPSRARKEIRCGDILVSTVRPNLNAVAMVPPELDGEIASTGFCVLRPNRQAVDAEYLLRFCQSPQFIDTLVSRVRGAHYPAVSDSDIKQIQLPLPTLSEQRRIVKILNQADEARKLRSEVDAKADLILPALFIRLFGPPSSWGTHPRARPLGELVTLVSGATPSKRKGSLWQGDIPWVSPKDMKQDFIADSEDHVSPTALEATNLKLVPIGSVLIVVRGMILAHSVPVALSVRELTINQDMKALTPMGNSITGPLLWTALKVAKIELLGRVRTAAHGTRKIDTPELLELPIVVPDSAQRRASERAVQWLRESKRDREQRAHLLERLFAELLHRAFTGNLTVSWREAHVKELLEEMASQARALSETSRPEVHA